MVPDQVRVDRERNSESLAGVREIDGRSSVSVAGTASAKGEPVVNPRRGRPERGPSKGCSRWGVLGGVGLAVLLGRGWLFVMRSGAMLFPTWGDAVLSGLVGAGVLIASARGRPRATWWALMACAFVAGLWPWTGPVPTLLLTNPPTLWTVGGPRTPVVGQRVIVDGRACSGMCAVYRLGEVLAVAGEPTPPGTVLFERGRRTTPPLVPKGFVAIESSSTRALARSTRSLVRVGDIEAWRP